MQIRISQEDGTPIYQQVMHQVRLLVSTGRLEPGEQLPAVRRLARQLLMDEERDAMTEHLDADLYSPARFV